MINPSNPAPGVYGYLKDASERFPAVSSSIPAFVGEAERGDVGVATLCFDREDRRSKFGTLDPQKYGFSGYCLDRTLRNTNRAYFVRVVNQALTAFAWLTVDDPNATNPIIRLTNNSEAGSSIPSGNEDPFKNIGFVATNAGIRNVTGFFCARNPGDWNNKITVAVGPSNPAGVPIRTNGHNPKHFNVYVYYGTFVAGVMPVEKFTVSLDYEVNADGQQMYIEEVINNKSQFIKFKHNEIHGARYEFVTSAHETLDGGTNGQRATVNQIREAWELYADPERIEVSLLVNSGYTHHLIQHKMLEIAERRGDAYAILDVPSNMQEVSDAVSYRKQTLNANTYFGGIYGPDVLIYDEFTDRRFYIPISGDVAQRWAYTASNRFLWFAAAGMENGILQNVSGVRVEYDQGGRDALESAQVNYVRKLPDGQGFALWSQNTLYARASALRDANVVALSLYILKASKIYTENRLFDPNDSFLRAMVKQSADDFMRPILQGRGVEWFENRCDEKNNPVDVVANGDLILDMIYDPTIATKRVHVRFNINPKGSRFTGVDS
jgi:phage tail sheath protein FI